MTLAEDQERRRLLDRERDLEAAKPPLEKAREWEQQCASGHDPLIIGVTIIAALALLVVALMSLMHCGPAVHPPSGPGTDFPCGLRGVSCGGGMCCWLGDVCGSDAAFSTCRAGYCCAEGVDPSMGFARPAPYVQIDGPDMAAGKVAR